MVSLRSYRNPFATLVMAHLKMVEKTKTLTSIQPQNQREWRDWLTENHLSSTGIWLIYYKVKTQKPSIKYPEAVKEALCFGWIDSKVNSIDSESYQQIFTPRKPKSVWSALNKRYVQELIADNLMATAGLKAIEIAKQNGSWTSLDEVEALIIPPDLAQVFQNNLEAATTFESFNKSTKKKILFWITSAKLPTTRSKRIEQTLIATALGKDPLA